MLLLIDSAMPARQYQVRSINKGEAATNNECQQRPGLVQLSFTSPLTTVGHVARATNAGYHTRTFTASKDFRTEQTPVAGTNFTIGELPQTITYTYEQR